MAAYKTFADHIHLTQKKKKKKKKKKKEEESKLKINFRGVYLFYLP
jgi:hypothetical protein